MALKQKIDLKYTMQSYNPFRGFKKNVLLPLPLIQMSGDHCEYRAIRSGWGPLPVSQCGRQKWSTFPKSLIRWEGGKN